MTPRGLIWIFFVVAVNAINVEAARRKIIVSTVKPRGEGPFQLALDAILGVGIRLQAVLQDDQKENFLVSPISATVVLGQLLLGAEGDFRKQLINLISLPNSHIYENDKIDVYSGSKKNTSYVLPYSTFHVELSNLLRALEGPRNSEKRFVLKQENAVFVDSKISLRPQFKRNLKLFYQSDAKKLDFSENPVGAQRLINEWVRNNTNGLIKTVMGQPPPPNTASIFANAVYFLAEWKFPFSDDLNKEGLFSVSETKQVPVTYMIGLLEQIGYAESADYRLVVLPYKKDELGMYIILPNADYRFKYNIKNFVASMKSSEILETIAKVKSRDVIVKIPKMSVSSSFSILDQLKKYNAFRKQRADTNVSISAVDTIEQNVHAFRNFTSGSKGDIFLTDAAEGVSLRVDDIVQHVVVTVNEKGTEAAAVSLTTTDYMGGSKNFVVDRPFVFFIRHEATRATLFWGTIGNPSP